MNIAGFVLITNTVWERMWSRNRKQPFCIAGWINKKQFKMKIECEKFQLIKNTMIMVKFQITERFIKVDWPQYKCYYPWQWFKFYGTF